METLFNVLLLFWTLVLLLYFWEKSRWRFWWKLAATFFAGVPYTLVVGVACGYIQALQWPNPNASHAEALAKAWERVEWFFSEPDSFVGICLAFPVFVGLAYGIDSGIAWVVRKIRGRGRKGDPRGQAGSP
ncbi:MAG: hypothetical protein ACP5NF_11980 [Thermoanaerobaculum sp.]